MRPSLHFSLAQLQSLERKLTHAKPHTCCNAISCNNLLVADRMEPILDRFSTQPRQVTQNPNYCRKRHNRNDKRSIRRNRIAAKFNSIESNSQNFHNAPTLTVAENKHCKRRQPAHGIFLINSVSTVYSAAPKENVQASPSGDDALKDLETITQAYKNQIRLD